MKFQAVVGTQTRQSAVLDYRLNSAASTSRLDAPSNVTACGRQELWQAEPSMQPYPAGKRTISLARELWN